MFLNLLKKTIQPKQPTDPLELALLKSLRDEPSKWHITRVSPGGEVPFLRALNREHSTIIESRAMYSSSAVLTPVASCGKLEFSSDFSREWCVLVVAELDRREAEDTAVAAAQTRAHLEKEFGG